MKIDKIIETDGGAVQFQGEITGVELDLVVQVGLNYLLKAGVIPMIQKQLPEERDVLQ